MSKSSCKGVYADVVKTEIEKDSHYNRMITEYTEKKRHYVKNIGFNSSHYDNLFGKRAFWCYFSPQLAYFSLGNEMPGSKIDVILIYFDTASFERDKKMKFETQLSLIGGTMGLLTGFSIISGVEIVCFVAPLILSSVTGNRKSQV